jgi:hypothetical protein
MGVFFGTGKHHRGMPVHEIAEHLGIKRAEAMRGTTQSHAVTPLLHSTQRVTHSSAMYDCRSLPLHLALGNCLIPFKR